VGLTHHHTIIASYYQHIYTLILLLLLYIYIYIYFTLLYYSFNYSIYYSIRVGVGVCGVYIIQLRLFAHANNKDKVILIKNISAY
jgi:multidrug transporter EmrE-like cation transporter